MRRANPRRRCSRSEAVCESENSDDKVKIVYFIQKNKPIIHDPFRGELWFLHDEIPENLLYEFASEKFKINGSIHITRGSIAYSAARYIQSLRETIEKLKSGKFIFCRYCSSFCLKLFYLLYICFFLVLCVCVQR